MRQEWILLITHKQSVLLPPSGKNIKLWLPNIQGDLKNKPIFFIFCIWTYIVSHLSLADS